MVTAVPLAGAKRPKLMKRVVSQESRIRSMGMDMEVDSCSYINHRVSWSEIRMLKPEPDLNAACRPSV